MFSNRTNSKVIDFMNNVRSIAMFKLFQNNHKKIQRIKNVLHIFTVGEQRVITKICAELKFIRPIEEAKHGCCIN